MYPKNKEKLLVMVIIFQDLAQYQFYGLKYFLNKKGKSNAVGHNVRYWLKCNNLLEQVYLD